jgi:hypothetical protein
MCASCERIFPTPPARRIRAIDLAYVGYLCSASFFLLLAVWMIGFGRFPHGLWVVVYVDPLGLPIALVAFATLVISLWLWKHWQLLTMAVMTLVIVLLGLKGAFPSPLVAALACAVYGLTVLAFVRAWFKTLRSQALSGADDPVSARRHLTIRD